MSKEEKEPSRLCPFKKTTEREYNASSGRGTLNEYFAPCAGERCMAYYQVGNRKMCRRLQEAKK